MSTTAVEFRPLNVVAAPHSDALHRNDEWLADEQHSKLIADQIAPGFTPNAQYDLSYFAGPTIATATVMPIYVGGDGTQAGGAAAWTQSDMTAVDQALAHALGDTNLESVMAQYFPSQPSASVAGSAQLTNQATTFQQTDVESMVRSAYQGGTLTGDATQTLFCFMLSPGTRLFASDGSDSYNGLGGYHGSISVGGTTVYYAVGVYSETSGGVTNGIPAFNQPWKNVVATFYHEINEWRTDAAVEQATSSNVNGVLGWYSQQYGEIGDIPITEAGANLSEVFVEVTLAAGGGTVPVQLMYSNYDHGPAEVTSATPGWALGGGAGGAGAGQPGTHTHHHHRTHHHPAGGQ
jgi:hypothetical protein